MTANETCSLQKLYQHAVKDERCKVLDYPSRSEPLIFDQIDKICTAVSSHLRDVSSPVADKSLGIVAFAFKNSLAGLVSLLSCMKVGLPFHPFDPSSTETPLPLLRNFNIPVKFLLHERFISDDPSLKYLASYMEGSLHVYRVQIVSQNPKYDDLQSDLAYAISTSGSTGPSKLVLVSHYSILSNVFEFSKVFQLTENDTILQNTSYLFDPSLVEVLLWLFCGATLVVFPSSIKLSCDKFCTMVDETRATFLQTTPSTLALWGREQIGQKLLSSSTSLRVLAFGGEIHLSFLSFSVIHIGVMMKTDSKSVAMFWVSRELAVKIS